MFCYRFGVEQGGNVEEDPHGEFRGRNILYQARSIEENRAAFAKVRMEEARAILKSSCVKLLEMRGARPRPRT